MLIPFIWVMLILSAAAVSVHAALLARSPDPGGDRKNLGRHRMTHRIKVPSAVPLEWVEEFREGKEQ